MSRNLDAAIAEALGLDVSHVADDYIFYADGKWRPVPGYSKRGDCMLKLDAEMRARGWWLEMMEYDRPIKGLSSDWTAYYRDKSGNRGGGVAAFEPLARALAAHEALYGEAWEESP